MHLLSLLIAAVLSSQFVAPNEGETLTVKPEKVTWAVLNDVLPEMTFTLSTATVGAPVKWYLSVSDNPAVTEGRVEISDQTTTDTGKKVYTFTHAAGQPSLAAIITLKPRKLYVHYEEDPTLKLKASFEVTPDFTVDTTKIPITMAKTTRADTTLVLNEVATEPTWKSGETLNVLISSVPTGASKTKTFTVDTWTNPGEASVKIENADWGTLAITETPAKIYVWATLTNAPVPSAELSFDIDIVEDIKVAAPITETTKTIAGTITVSKDIAALVDDNELDIYVSYVAVNPSTLTSIGKATLKGAAGTLVYDLPEVALPTKTPRLVKNDKVYFYASYVLKEESNTGEKVYYDFPEIITVTEDTTNPYFEVSPKTIPVKNILTHDKITITQTAGATWNEIKVQLQLKDKGTAYETSAALPVTLDVAELAWNEDIKTYLTGAKIGQTITVKAALAAATWANVVGVDITLTGEILCEIDPTSVKLTQWKAGHTFTVTPKPAVTWDTTESAIIVSLSPEMTAVTTDIIKKGLAKPAATVSVAIAAGDLTDFGKVDVGTPVYFFVSEDGVKKDDQIPAQLTITKDDPVLEFDVEPEEIKTGATKIDTLTIKPKTPAGWADPIAFKVTDIEPTAFAQSNAEKTGTAAKDGNVWKATNVDLTGFNLADGKKLYVYASKSGAAPYLEVYDTIDITAASTLSWVLDPASIAWAAALKLEKTQIKPTPEHPAGWPVKDAKTMKFRISPPAASSANDEPIAPITGTVTVEGDAGEEKYYIPKDTDISKLIPAEPTADVSLKVELSVVEDEWLKESSTLKVTKPTEPPPPEAAMGASPLLSLLAALVFLFVKLF